MDVDPLRRTTGLALDDFAAAHWAREPRLSRAADLPGDGFADLLDLDDVDELVSRRGLRTPFLRLAREGEVLPTGRFTRGGGAGAEIGDQVADDKVLAELDAGATLVLQGLHRVWPPVVAFATSFSAQLGHPVQVNAYVTPAQNTGFAPHYDVHDVFVLQLAGRKHWKIHRPVLEAPLRDQPWDARRDEVAAAAAEEPLIDAALEPGDALYLPRGYLHAATALGEISAHLTIGVQPVTRSLLAEQVLAQLADDVELRRSLPVGVDLAHAEVLADEVKATQEALHRAIDRLDVDAVAALVDAHLGRTTRPAPLSPIAQLAAAEALGDDTPVRLRPGLRTTLTHVGDKVALKVFAKTITFPGRMTAALETVLTGDVVRAATLQDGEVLLGRLLREGVVVPATPPIHLP